MPRFSSSPRLFLGQFLSLHRWASPRLHLRSLSIVPGYLHHSSLIKLGISNVAWLFEVYGNLVDINVIISALLHLLCWEYLINSWFLTLKPSLVFAKNIFSEAPELSVNYFWQQLMKSTQQRYFSIHFLHLSLSPFLRIGQSTLFRQSCGIFSLGQVVFMSSWNLLAISILLAFSSFTGILSTTGAWLSLSIFSAFLTFSGVGGQLLVRPLLLRCPEIVFWHWATLRNIGLIGFCLAHFPK